MHYSEVHLPPRDSALQGLYARTRRASCPATISRPSAPAIAYTLPCDHQGGRVEIGFELRFLNDALGVLGSPVRFALSGPRARPALITAVDAPSDETPGVQLVIMPRVVPDASVCDASLRGEA